MTEEMIPLIRYLCTECGAAYHSDESKATICNRCSLGLPSKGAEAMKTKIDMIDYILTMVKPLHQDEVRKILQEVFPEVHTLTKEHTYWNGLPTSAIRGTAIVADMSAFPEYWARVEGLIGTRIPVVRVNFDGVIQGGDIAYLDNRDDEGWIKITEGRGSPTYSHKTVFIAPRSFERI